ncbi:MAG: hypothetical protein NT166_12160 [Candidatus Aminicenantes bacterium]|nr:hypothetical protein [Candidatus Aminicenantes bacterium]
MDSSVSVRDNIAIALITALGRFRLFSIYQLIAAKKFFRRRHLGFHFHTCAQYMEVISHDTERMNPDKKAGSQSFHQSEEIFFFLNVKAAVVPGKPGDNMKGPAILLL